MSVLEWKRPLAAVCLALVLGVSITGCSDDDSDDNDGNDPSPELTSNEINDTDGTLNANIRYTTGGVPHITASNLESAAFGSGYAQAKANVCIIADQILRVRGERSRYYGPGPSPQPGVIPGPNIISDFSIKALGLLAKAKAEYDDLSAVSQAMLRGFAAGYNHYLEETNYLADTGRHGKCAGQPWVQKITPQDLYAYYHLIALLASGLQFTTGVTFAAAPPGVSPAPAPVIASRPAPADQPLLASLDGEVRYRVKTDFTERGMGSNGWGLGGELTENGRGALLANPHFPYTGNRRLYQSHITVPGVYDVNGAALIGFVIPLIGFNENVAWTHTVSTAQHFTFYALELKAGDNLTYMKDGQEKPITSKAIQIQVATPGGLATFEKTFYYSEYGPMINANLISGSLPVWGGSFAGKPSVAFTYRDANIDTAHQVIDQWLAMGMADNLAEFKQPFQSCGTVLWVNTMYADAEGNAFYIDATAVPNLSRDALTAYANRVSANPVVAGLAAAGITLLDGSTSRDDWVEGQCNGRVPYAGLPKLTRADYVQNSNDSYWATNLDALLTGYSPLFGATGNILSPRTRMGLKMITNRTDSGLSEVQPAGQDGKFTAREIMDMLYSNRAYYAETLLDDLLARCEAIGATPVSLPGASPRPVENGCNALAGWNGVYNVDSTGAHVFRVFIGHYDNAFPEVFTVPFDPANPATTPRDPGAPAATISQDPMLQALAQGLNALKQVDIEYNAALGTVQYELQSAAVPPRGTAMPAGGKIPWHGTQNIEGGFNIVRPYIGGVDDGTRFPRVSPSDSLDDTGQLSTVPGQGWAVAYGTSWHFGLMFTDNGPEAWGLLSYSQSVDSASPHFADQDKRYSAKNYRELLYSEQEIAADPNLTTVTITAPDTSD